MNVPPEIMSIHKVLQAIPGSIRSEQGVIFSKAGLQENIWFSSINPFLTNFVLLGLTTSGLSVFIDKRMSSDKNCHVVVEEVFDKLDELNFEQLTVGLGCSAEEFLEGFQRDDYSSLIPDLMNRSAAFRSKETSCAEIELGAPNPANPANPDERSIAMPTKSGSGKNAPRGRTRLENFIRSAMKGIPEELLSLDGRVFERFNVNESLIQSIGLSSEWNVVFIGVISNGSGVFVDRDREPGRNCCLLAVELLYLRDRFPFSAVSVSLGCPLKDFIREFPKRICPAPPVDYHSYISGISAQEVDWLKRERIKLMTAGVRRRDFFEVPVPPGLLAQMSLLHRIRHDS